MKTREPRTSKSSEESFVGLTLHDPISKVGSGLIGTMVLTGIVLLAMRSFIVSPVFELVAIAEQAWLVLLVLFLAYTVSRGFVSRSYSMDRMEVVVSIMMILPIMAALGAHREYGQPYIHGILAFKDYYLFCTALLIYHLLKRGIVTIRQLEIAMTIAAVSSLVLFYGMSLFTNPAKYSDTVVAGSQSTKGGGIYYRFSMGLIFYGAIYFFIAWLRNARWSNLLLCGLFVIYIVFFRLDRTSIVACLFALAMAWLLLAPKSVKLRSLLYVGLPASIFVLMVLVAVPSILETVSLMFWDAFSTLTGDNHGAGQARLRTYEAGIVVEQIAEHPLLGNGRVSNSWVEGAFDHFYRFFYPGDVGFLGTIFIFGVFGAAALYSQFLLITPIFRNAKWKQGSTFTLGLLFYLLILFVDSLSNGSLVVYSSQTVIAAMALYFISQQPAYDRLA